MKKTLKTTGMLIAAVYTSFSAMLLFGETGEAYVDPSVVTYIIQAVAGVVIAAGAVFGVYWRKTRKKINDKLGIDENRNKEVESDDFVSDVGDEEAK